MMYRIKCQFQPYTLDKFLKNLNKMIGKKNI